MAFEILNEAASVVYVLAGENRYPQAEPDKVDFDILAQGINEEGVVSGGAVTPQGAPDTTVAVAAAVVRIGGTDVAFAGGNVNCGAAAVGFPRFDLIAISNAGVASAVNGVAAAVPVFPAVPANSVIVAAVWRAANDNTITATDIVDKRVDLLSATFGTVPTLIPIDGAGIADPDRFHHTLSANAGVADDLNGMTASSIISNGEPLIIRPDAGDTITVKHNALGGADARNILCIGNADIVLDDDHDFAWVFYSTAIGAGSWMALGGGAAAGGHVIENEGAPLAARANLNFAGGLVDAADNAPDTDVHIGKQPDRTDLFTTANANPHLSVGGTGKGIRFDDYLGIDSAPSSVIKLSISPTPVGVIGWTGIGMSPIITFAGNNRGAVGIFGSANAKGAAGSTGHRLSGLDFVATGLSTAGAITFASVIGAQGRAGGLALGGGTTVTITDLIGLLGDVAFSTLNGNGIATNVTCVRAQNTGFGTLGTVTINISAYRAFHHPAFALSDATVIFTTAYGLHLEDITGTSFGAVYLIEAGPATPYFRVVGDFTAAAHATAVYVSEGAAPTLRQLKSTDMAYLSITTDEDSAASAAEYDVFDDANYVGVLDFTDNVLGAAAADPFTTKNVTFTRSNGRFTVNEDGIYAISISVLMQAVSVTPEVVVRIKDGGAAFYSHQTEIHSAIDWHTFAVTVIRSLSAGDFINVTIDSQTATTIIVGDGTTMSIHKLADITDDKVATFAN